MSVLRLPPPIDAPRARPTAELPAVFTGPTARVRLAVGVGQRGSSAATEARRPSALSEALLFRAYRNAVVPPEDNA